MHIPWQKSARAKLHSRAGRMSLFSHVITALAIVAVTATTSALADSVNINSADSQTLARSIEGVGEKLGEAIVKHRQLHGPFKKVDELVDVKGVGPKLLERNRDRLRLNNGPAKPIIKKAQ